MKKILLASFLCLSIGFADAQLFNGKPLYDVLVRQYPDTFGTFRMELYPTIAPLHCENFDTLAQQGFYDSLAFHRVVPNFVIQGGDPNSKTGPPNTWGQGAPWQNQVPAEFSPLSHDRSIIGAARGTNINSATSQFYVNLANNTNLNGNYTAYGKVISGMNVVDSVEDVPRDANDLPLQKVDMFISYVGVDTSAPAQAPSLLAPADGAVDLFGDETFSWSAVNSSDFILYRIEFSKQSDFSSIDYYVDISKSKTNTKPLPNLEQGFVTYYWRVLTNNGGRMTASASRSFTTYIAPPLLNRPIDGATNTFMNPEFKWYSVTDANAYNLVVSNIPALTIPSQNVVDINTQVTNYFSPDLGAGNKYYWGVRSIKNGIPGAFSELREFTTGNVLNISVEAEINRVKVYPNPNAGTLFLDLKHGEEATLQLMDLQGRVISEHRLDASHNQVDVSNLERGTYLFAIESESHTEYGRVIIE